jgi:hypothetical protein
LKVLFETTPLAPQPDIPKSTFSKVFQVNTLFCEYIPVCDIPYRLLVTASHFIVLFENTFQSTLNAQSASITKADVCQVIELR